MAATNTPPFDEFVVNEFEFDIYTLAFEKNLTTTPTPQRQSHDEYSRRITNHEFTNAKQ